MRRKNCQKGDEKNSREAEPLRASAKNGKEKILENLAPEKNRPKIDK